ncbi:MAG: hypothetical protein Q8P67_21520 [archaeon]|nr:hypothetical protein [archaeon]
MLCRHPQPFGRCINRHFFLKTSQTTKKKDGKFKKMKIDSKLIMQGAPPAADLANLMNHRSSQPLPPPSGRWDWRDKKGQNKWTELIKSGALVSLVC